MEIVDREAESPSENGAVALNASRRRRERERVEMRTRLLATARAIAVEDGWQAVTIRKIADRLEYAPPILYQYFANKDALLLELVREGFEEAGRRLAAAAKAGEPGRQLAALADAAWEFAFTSPELYQVMNGLGGVGLGTTRAPVEAQQAFIVIRDALVEDAAAMGRHVPDPNAMVDTVWALVHGFISLAMAERIGGGPERARGLMAAALPAVFESCLE